MATNNAANINMTVGSANEIGMPVQPAFIATLSSQQANVTGNTTWYTIVCDTEVFDQGSNYNNGTGEFIAPVSGAYVFSARAYLSGATALRNIIVLIQTSNRFYECEYSRTASNVDARCEVTVFADMDAADIAYAVVIGTGEGSDINDLMPVSGSDTRTSFSGYLAV